MITALKYSGIQEHGNGKMLLCWFGLGWSSCYGAVFWFCAENNVNNKKNVFTIAQNHGLFCFSPHRERAGGPQNVGQVTADPNWSEEHPIPYSIVFSNKIARSFSGLVLFRDCLGLAGSKQLGFLPINFFFFSLLNFFLSQPMRFIPFALLVLFPISLWRSEEGLAVYWGQITTAIKKKCHQIPLELFSCLLQIMTYLICPGFSLVTLGLNKSLLYVTWVFLKTEAFLSQ